MKAKILFLCFMLMFAINSYGQSGQDGNISWSITDRTLTFTGTGNMKNYDFKRMPPWSSYSEQIEKVIIGDGVTLFPKAQKTFIKQRIIGRTSEQLILFSLTMVFTLFPVVKDGQ